MTKTALKELRINALALRNIADKVLARLEQLDAAPVSPVHRKKLNHEADLKVRILTGKGKSTLIKNKNRCSNSGH